MYCVFMCLLSERGNWGLWGWHSLLNCLLVSIYYFNFSWCLSMRSLAVVTWIRIPKNTGNIKTYGTNKTSDEINHFHARDDGMEIHTLLFQVQVSITNRVKNVKLSEWLTDWPGTGISGISGGLWGWLCRPQRIGFAPPQGSVTVIVISSSSVSRSTSLSCQRRSRVEFITSICVRCAPPGPPGVPFSPPLHIWEIWYKWVFTLCVDERRALVSTGEKILSNLNIFKLFFKKKYIY